jgi:hypothetical protein
LDSVHHRSNSNRQRGWCVWWSCADADSPGNSVHHLRCNPGGNVKVMKLVSGKKKMERQSNALDRLLNPARDKREIMMDLEGKPDEKRIAAWTTRRDAEIATLRQRTGRIHES